MNLDRPLDDLVKESLAAKRAERAEKRKALQAARQRRVQPRKPTNVNPPTNQPATNLDPSDSTMDVDGRRDKLNPRRRGAGIGKRRRQKRKSLGDMEVDTDRKPSPAAGPPSQGNVITTYPRGKAVKVVVSNLHPQVTQTDIAELFETVGPLKSAMLNRYPNGASACEAEVVFENMPDALEAIKRYNMVPLDNQPLQITLVTTRTGKTRRGPQKKTGAQQDEEYRSPEADKANGFEDRSPERAPPRRRQGRRRRFNRQDDRRPDDRRQDDRRQEDRRPDDRRQDERRPDDRRPDDRRPDDRRQDDRRSDDRRQDDRLSEERHQEDRRPDDREDRDRDMYVD